MRRAFRPLIVLLALLPAAVGAQAAPQAEAGRLTGQLLVAAPELDDPHFRHTVVLIVHHDAKGALGLVLNRPYGKAPANELMRRLGLPDQDARGEIALGYGGPVQPEIGMVVHSADYRLAGTQQVTPDLAVTSDPQVLHDMAAGKGPQRALAVLGYAGWGPGQLEAEMAQDAWFAIPADPALIFRPDPAAEWQDAVGRRGVDL